jgi:deoxyribonuclease (pyrimidine dimer)
MTRVNVVPPSDLCDQHLLAEHREITRIPNAVKSGKAKIDGTYPHQYTLGKGHVKFFYIRLGWLKQRYESVHYECIRRGFNVTNKWPDGLSYYLCGDYTVSEEDIQINLERIKQRMPVKARWTKGNG